MPENCYLSYLEKECPRPGDIIRVIGYPGEYNGHLYEMQETIDEIQKSGENYIIIYKTLYLIRPHLLFNLNIG